MSSVELEESILDVDGRISRAERQGADDMSANFRDNVQLSPQTIHGIRAAKAMSIWRWRDAFQNDFAARMGAKVGIASLVP